MAYCLPWLLLAHYLVQNRVVHCMKDDANLSLEIVLRWIMNASKSLTYQQIDIDPRDSSYHPYIAVLSGGKSVIFQGQKMWTENCAHLALSCTFAYRHLLLEFAFNHFQLLGSDDVQKYKISLRQCYVLVYACLLDVKHRVETILVQHSMVLMDRWL